MDFGIHGVPTARVQRQPIGSARRQSALQSRNPITGEDFIGNHEKVASHPPMSQTSQKRPQNVPSLNLSYLGDKEEPTGALDVSLRDYKLNSPGSASTVSWGTPKSAARPYIQKQKITLTQPHNVPGLSLGEKKCLTPKKVLKEPSAWDKVPVPEDLPPPSSRHQEMYNKYSEDMKKAYHAHASPHGASEAEILKAVSAMKQAYQSNVPGMNSNQNQDDEFKNEIGEDVVDDSWKKQRYSSKELMKKLDAEELLEYNKKQKLIETVMIDQLSRAVISDPEQDQKEKNLGNTARLRGTNRYLHDSKVSTRSTATENLLSKRVRFGTRIITRNGRDAVRELTGFFFQVDRTLTVYEFKQFGKSAKAMPFIQRGIFRHPRGPKSGMPYSLSDINVGADLEIPTEQQHALSAELARLKFLTLRVTDVDEEEKSQLMNEDIEPLSTRHDTPSRLDQANRDFLASIQEKAGKQIQKRSIKTMTGLGRHYRQLDRNGTGILDQHDLERGLLHFHIDVPPQDLELVFDVLDHDGMRQMDYSSFMHAMLGEMNEFRKALVRKAFAKIDTHKQGNIHVSDIRKFFNANCAYKQGSDADSTKSALQGFLDAVRSSERQEEVSFIEFEEYYEGLSLGVKDDRDFANILHNTWNI